ncbi:MAG: cytochrome c [Chloroflexi bacterium]|nr:cytochrome c [Chloroflexota bacterium]
MNRKKIALLALFILLVGLLIGCGGGSESSSDSEIKPRDETAEVAEEVHSGDPDAGDKQFQQLCATCHGPDAKGVPNLGKDLTTSEFLKTKTDDEFLAFVIAGRPSGDPENTTGIDMPPRGGNPALTDDQIMDIIAYVRTLQE